MWILMLAIASMPAPPADMAEKAAAKAAFYKGADLSLCKGEVYASCRDSFKESFKDSFKTSSGKTPTAMFTDAAAATSWTIMMPLLFPGLKGQEMADLLDDPSDRRWVPALSRTGAYARQIQAGCLELGRQGAKFPRQAYLPE